MSGYCPTCGSTLCLCPVTRVVSVGTIHVDDAAALMARVASLEEALGSTVRELEAWHSERPCPPEMRDSCVSCGVIDHARAALAGEGQSRTESTEENRVQ